MTRSPHANLPTRAFWRGGVAGASAVPPDIHPPKFPISQNTRVFTAGSCFAQHIGAAMKHAVINVIDTEPAARGLPPDMATCFGKGVHSARFGNICTATHFRQLVVAFGGARPALPVWERNGRFRDAPRPGVQPAGLVSSSIALAPRRADPHRAASGRHCLHPRPGGGVGAKTHRHMNKDFGTSLFAAFALTLPPTIQT